MLSTTGLALLASDADLLPQAAPAPDPAVSDGDRGRQGRVRQSTAPRNGHQPAGLVASIGLSIDEHYATRPVYPGSCLKLNKVN